MLLRSSDHVRARRLTHGCSANRSQTTSTTTGDLMNPVSAHHRATSARTTTLQSRRAGPNQRPRMASRLTVAATVLLSLTLGPSAASAATLQPAPTLGAVRTGLDAALNDVVAAGVPGIIV